MGSRYPWAIRQCWSSALLVEKETEPMQSFSCGWLGGCLHDLLVGLSGSVARGTFPSEVQRRFPVGGRILEACGAESQARNSSLKFGPGKTPELKVKGLKCRIASGPVCDHFGITLGSLRLHAPICMPNVRSKLRLLFNV